MEHRAHERGITVVEVMIGLGILAMIFLFISTTTALFFQAQKIALESTKALYLAEEAQETLRYIRDEDWTDLSTLTTDTTYYLDLATSSIAITNTPEVIDTRYTRSFVVQDAYRDSNDDFTASTTPGASVDAGSLIVIVRVNWDDEQIQLKSLLTNIHDI